MKKTIFFIIFLFLNLYYTFSQVKFQKTYKFYGYSEGMVVPTNDGTGYFLEIVTNDSTITQNDFCLAKINLFGDTIWTKIYGGNGNDAANKFFEDGLGNINIIGNTGSFGSASSSLYLLKTNSIGDTLWTKVIGNTHKIVTGNSVKLANGSFIILDLIDTIGTSLWDSGLIKIDSSGNVLWNKFYGGANDDELHSIIQLDDGGFILSGGTTTYGAGDYDSYIMRTDSLGAILWSKTYGGALFENSLSSIKCSDGVIIAGGTKSFGFGGNDICIIKLDFNGNIMWAKAYGTSIDEMAYNIKQTSDNGFIIGGFYGVITADRGEMAMKIDSLGNFQWAKSYGSSTCNDDFTGLNLTNDGGYIISGTSCSFGGFIYNAYIIKTDSLGNSGCNEQNRVFSTVDITSSITVTNPTPNVYSDPTIVAKSTQTKVYHGPLTISSLCFTNDVDETKGIKNEFKIYPNPANNFIDIETELKNYSISVFDNMGKLILKEKSNQNNTRIDLSPFSNGIYFIQLQSDGKLVSKKFIKE